MSIESSSGNQRDLELAAIDPLGGILHPNWEHRKTELEAEKKHSFVRRYLTRKLAQWRADEPSLTTGDTRLDVDPGESENLSRLTLQQARDAAALVSAMEGYQPVQTTFYDGSLSKPSSTDSAGGHPE